MKGLKKAKRIIGETLSENAERDSNDALLSAIEENDLNRVRHALNNGADVNCKDSFSDETPLHKASVCKCGLDIFKLLLNCGADVNAKTRNKCTPLMYAILMDIDIAICDLLIEYGAVMNVPNRTDDTPPHTAVRKSLGLSRLFIENRADANVFDYTPSGELRWEISKNDIKKPNF